MTTRLELRTALRVRLEDTGFDPLWDDLLLNETIWNALVRFSARMPLEAVHTQLVTAGATNIPVSPNLVRERILRVIDARGEEVPEGGTAHQARPGEALAWRWWNGALLLNRALGADETWRIEYRAPRSMPANDVDAIALEPVEIPVVVTLAAEAVLRRRAIEEVKRHGQAAGTIAVADMLAAEAQEMFRARKRTVRSGVFTVDGK